MRFGTSMEHTRRWGVLAMALVASFTTASGVAAQQAGAPANVTLFPPNDTTPTGSCADYTVTVTDEAGQPVQGVTVDVHQGKIDAMLEPDAFVELYYCDPEPGHTRNPTGQGGTEIRNVSGNNPSQTPGESGRNSSVHAEVGPTDANGDVTFGITIGPETAGGRVIVMAWIDFDEDDAWDLDEPSDGSDHRWVHADQYVGGIDAGPEFDTNPNGSLHVVTVVVTTPEGYPLGGFTPRSVILPDGSGQNAGDVADPAAGPSPNATVRGAPPWAYQCTASNSQGHSTCTFQDPVSTGTGTDTIAFFWDRGGEARWPDGPDPRDTVQKTWATPATPSPSPAPTPTPTASPSPPPTATPTQSPFPSPTPTPAPVLARNVRLCQGSSAVACDTSSHSRDAGDVHEVTALVTDRNGMPVANVPVQLRETGPARFTATGTSSVVVTTANDGAARAVLFSDDPGTSTIGAEISPPGAPGSFRGPASADDECEQPAGPGGAPPAGNCIAPSLTVSWTEVVDGIDCDDGIDNDGDTLVDFPDDPGCTGDNDGTEEPFNARPIPHARTISLHFEDSDSGRLRVFGRLQLAEADDGPRRCVRNVEVTVERLVDGEWAERARDGTNRRGRYSETIRDVTGTYRAVVTRSELEVDGVLHVCLRADKHKTHHHRR